MSILVSRNTRLVVQGITGGEGTFHTKQMMEYGTKVVAGVTPGKGGTNYGGTEKDPFPQKVPVFNTVSEAVKATGANTSVIFVPAAFAGDAIIEAADAGVDLIVCITEGIPTLCGIQVLIDRQGRLAEEPSFPQGCRREPEVALRAHPERPARSREG